MEGSYGGICLHRRIIFHHLGDAEFFAVDGGPFCRLSGEKKAVTAGRFPFRHALLPVAMGVSVQRRDIAVLSAVVVRCRGGLSAETVEKFPAAVFCGMGSILFVGRRYNGSVYADAKPTAAGRRADFAAKQSVSLATAFMGNRYGVYPDESDGEVGGGPYPKTTGILLCGDFLAGQASRGACAD